MNSYSAALIEYCPKCGSGNFKREVIIHESEYVPVVTCGFCSHSNSPSEFSHIWDDELKLLEHKDSLRNNYLNENNLEIENTKIDTYIKKIIFFRDCAEYEKSIETNETSKHYYSGKQAGLQVALNILKS